MIYLAINDKDRKVTDMAKQNILFSPQEVSRLMEQESVVVIDVRDTEFFKEEHIPGAVNAPDIFYYLSETTPEALLALQQKFTALLSEIGVSGSEKVILYEESMDSRYGSSCRGYWLLSYLGHPDAGVLNGGFMAWAAAGLPVESGSAVTTSAEFNLNPQPTLLATKDEVLQAINDQTTILLDDRDSEEWVGDSSSPYGIDYAPRKGRLPGAKWIEWYEFMDQSTPIAVFKPGQEIHSLCQTQHNLKTDDNIIIYCFKGARASNTYVALKEAGYKNVKVYFGSWNEWSRNPALPIDDEKYAG